MGNETNKEKKGKAAIVDEPMTPVPLDQRQHWITPAVIFGGLEFCVPILMINWSFWNKRYGTSCIIYIFSSYMGREFG